MALITAKNVLSWFGDNNNWDTIAIDLTGGYPSSHQLDPLVAAIKQGDTLEGLIRRLHCLADDDHVSTVIVRVHGLHTSLATAAAIGAQLRQLAERKTVIASLQQISMQSVLATAGVTETTAPAGAEVMLLGFGLEQVFLGGFLRKYGISFENMRIREYKSALTRFSDERMDDYNREQLTAYLSAVEDQWVSDIATARGCSPEQVRSWWEADLVSAAGAVEAGVIDRVAWEDELYTAVPTRLLDHLDKILPQLKSTSRKDRIAVVPVMGAIVPGRHSGGPFAAQQRAASEIVVSNLRRAKQDEHTRAIVLHVDSGGGSALASDLICREVATSDKPVIAVMGSVAASGGYYVLAQADHIIASPYTITGSIGVVVGKPVLAELQQRHGMNREVVGREDALFGSVSRGFTERQRSWADAMMEGVYQQFCQVVATGRNMTTERVDEIGRGRIWSGRDALELGLVDQLGNTYDAIVEARRRADLADDAPVWTPTTPRLPVPQLGRRKADVVADWVWPFGREQVLAWWDMPFRLV